MASARRFTKAVLHKAVRHDMAADIGEAEFSALVFEGEAFMIEAQQMQYVTQEPKLGRPPRPKPVCKKICAGA